jgi:sugar phosphate isomerase/epimerase
MSNEIGVMVQLKEDGPCFQEVQKFGLDHCQLVSWEPGLWTEERANDVRREYEKCGINVNALWAGWSGPAEWNLVEGPETLGLVPREYRAKRVEELKRAGEFARQVGLAAVITHLGFLPVNPRDELFFEVVEAVREVAQYMNDLGVEFWFETGQEPPVVMLRLIEAVGLSNLGVNLDPANLIMYGFANPVDSLLVFGKYVREVHAKDGKYPTDPMQLGEETKIGSGHVCFPELIRRLKEIGFKGQFIIEREISGDEQRRDIVDAILYLREYIEE